MAAFSLTEVVVALGVFAVSMVGIIALFPIASATGRESSEETQAAILAQTILDDLRSTTSVKGAGGGFIIKGPNTFNNAQWTSVKLTNASTNFVAYDLISRTNSSGPDGVGMVGNPIALKAILTTLTTSSYANPITTANAIFVARIDIAPATSLNGLASVTITVETPASVAQANRRTYLFQSLISAHTQ